MPIDKPSVLNENELWVIELSSYRTETFAQGFILPRNIHWHWHLFILPF